MGGSQEPEEAARGRRSRERGGVQGDQRMTKRGVAVGDKNVGGWENEGAVELGKMRTRGGMKKD